MIRSRSSRQALCRAVLLVAGTLSIAAPAVADEPEDPKGSAPRRYVAPPPPPPPPPPAPPPSPMVAPAPIAPPPPSSAPSLPPAAATKPPPVDEEDPKADRSSEAEHKMARDNRPLPVAKISYRYLTIANLDLSSLQMNAGHLDLYPLSLPWFRVGLEAEIANGSGVIKDTVAGKTSDKSINAWYVETGLSAGLQYPWYVTPFVDGRFGAGLIGGDVAGTTAVTWMWHAGVEVGAEFYVHKSIFLSGAIGWVHTSYHGVDLKYADAHPTSQPLYTDLPADSFTFKLGLGL